MPIINKKYRKLETKGIKRTYESKKNNLNHKAVYNTTIWKKLRLQFLSENPLCRRCLEKDKISSAVEVHHIIEVDNGKTITEKKTIGFDYNNLEGLCRECHIQHHRNKRENK